MIEGPAIPRERRLSPRMRRLVLATHVIVSVGWLGIVVAMLLLSIIAATTREVGMAGVAYRLLEDVSSTLVAPPPASFSLAALLTGIVLSIGTKWGLLDHYWVVAKLVLTVATILSGIFLVDQWIRQTVIMPEVATNAAAAGSLPTLLIYGFAVHLLMLGAATVISVYKPWGKTRFGRRGRRVHPRW